MKTIQRIVEIPLLEVQSKDYNNNIERYGDHSDTCLICGKRTNASKAKQVHYLTNGNIISTDQDHEDSQGFFYVGNDCAKKLIIQFTFN